MILENNPHINILNTRVNLINIDQLHSNISHYILNKQKVTIGNLNINAANIAFSNPWYAEYLSNCPIIFCDGKGIQLAAALLGKKIPPHITYHTWIWDLLNFSKNSDFSLFFLGSRKSVIENAITRVKQKIPNINVMGHHGFFNKSNKENDDVIKMINLFNPDIIIVGFGMPLQERWIQDNMENLNAFIYLNGGAFLEWLSGNQKQAPSWMTKLGLEWFYRFIKEPRRLFRRYIIGNPLFIYRIIKQRIKGK